MGSGERKRCSNMAPVRRLRNLAWMKARRLPGVRCSTLKTECRSLLCLMIMPGRSWVAGIAIAQKLSFIDCGWPGDWREATRSTGREVQITILHGLGAMVGTEARRAFDTLVALAVRGLPRSTLRFRQGRKGQARKIFRFCGRSGQLQWAERNPSAEILSSRCFHGRKV